MKLALKSASFSLVLIAGSGALAQSATIPKELLDLDRLRCMQGCEANASTEACTALCNCTVSEFQKRLNMDKYLTLSAQISRNELSVENRTLLDDVANYCVAELDKAGIDVGTGKASDGTENGGGTN